MKRYPFASFSLACLLPIAASAQVQTLKRMPAVAPAPAQGIVVQGGREAIGPKQDDPRAMDDGCDGLIVQGGREAIGPKQDDPKAAGTASLAIGPKQDDPRAAAAASRGTLAIGPKQDDPRAAAAAQARPGDDNDPKARCRAAPLPH